MTKLDRWKEKLIDLNHERSQLVYSLVPPGKEGSAAELARVQASDHPKLVGVNNRIADHVAERPEEED